MVKLITKNSIILLGVCMAAHYSFAEVKPAADATVAVETQGDVVAEKVATQGEIQIVGVPEARSRDPFWPVGFVPKKKTAAVESASSGLGEADAALDLEGLSPEERALIRERMKVGGILQQGTGILAMINNQLVRQGEKVTLESDRRSYDFRVKKLTPERIVLESLQGN